VIHSASGMLNITLKDNIRHVSAAIKARRSSLQ